MATAWRKVKAENDLNFTIQDMLKVYYGESDYAKYDNSACQWNQFLKDFCLDESSDYYPDKLKVAAILWKKVRDSKNKKVYSSQLLNENNGNKEGSAIKPLKTSGADIEQRTNRMGDTVLTPKDCAECYSNDPRITPLLHPLDCLKNHTQYICGTCGRCICIQHDSKRKLQRWNFPFNSLGIAKLYLRTADFTRKKPCGIYELRGKNGRVSYKIFADIEELQLYLKKNQEKTCKSMQPVFSVAVYREYENTQIRKLNYNEIKKYMSER